MDVSYSFFLFFFLFFCLFGAAPMVYGGSQGLNRSCSYATATATPNLSLVCNLYHSSWQCWLLNPLSEARDRTSIFMDTSQVCNPLSHNRNSSNLGFLYCSPIKGTWNPWRMVDPKAVQRIYLMSLRHFILPEQARIKMMGTYQRDTGDNLKELLTAKLEQFEQFEYWIIMQNIK